MSLGKPAAYWIDLFEKEGIPCKVNRVDEALESNRQKPTTWSSRWTILRRVISACPVFLSVFKNTGGRAVLPPLLGADTQEVLKRLLGKSDEDIEKLRASDVV